MKKTSATKKNATSTASKASSKKTSVQKSQDSQKKRLSQDTTNIQKEASTTSQATRTQTTPAQAVAANSSAGVAKKHSSFRDLFQKIPVFSRKKNTLQSVQSVQSAQSAQSQQTTQTQQTAKEQQTKKLLQTEQASQSTQPAKTAKVFKRPSLQLVKKRTEKAKLTFIQRRRNLDSYLTKAGYPDAKGDRVRERVKLLTLQLTTLTWIIPLVMAIINHKPLYVYVIYTLVSWTLFLALIWILIWGILYFFLEMRMYKRTKELEDVLPDFLQLTSANISAGMPIDRALWLAIRPNFGVLAKEIEDVAKATLSGQDLQQSLRDLVSRYDSVLLKRSISILLEGLEAGGELADLLNKIALNIEEIKIMKKEMAANVTTYAIFISFASVVVAPVLFGLATQLVQIILSITGSLDIAANSSIALTTTVDPSLIGNFIIYSYVMLTITAGMSAAIISVIQRGNVRDGIRNIPIYIGTSLVIYTIANIFLGSLFSGFF